MTKCMKPGAEHRPCLTGVALNQFVLTIATRDGGSKFSSLLNFQVKPPLCFYYKVIYTFIEGQFSSSVY